MSVICVQKKLLNLCLLVNLNYNCVFESGVNLNECTCIIITKGNTSLKKVINKTKVNVLQSIASNRSLFHF